MSREQTEKLSAIQQLASGIAHELNTPLGIIISNLTVLQRYFASLAAIAQSAQQALDSLESSPDGPGTLAMSGLAKTLDAIDLEFILEDLPLLMEESAASADRAAAIARSLASLARRDSSVETS